MLASTYVTVLQRPSQPLELALTRLQGWGCHIHRCATAAELFASLPGTRADLVLIDVGAEAAMALMAQLKADPETRHLPTIAMTLDDPGAVAAYALALGADDIFALPIADVELYTRVRALARLAALEMELRRRESVLATFGVSAGHDARAVPALDRTAILLIGPAGGDQVQVMSALGGAATAGYAETAGAALERLRREDLDVAIVTAARDSQEIQALCAAIRADAQLFDLPLLMVGRPDGFADAVTPFHWGASDVLLQPFHPEVLRLRVNGWVRQQRLRRRLRGDLGDGGVPPTTDRLTRLFGHGFLHGYVDHLIAAGPGLPALAVIGFAVAKMGRINQSFGYAAGDRVLAQLGGLLARAGRADDLPARFGDDRFCMVVNGAGGHEARTVADRIAAIVTQTSFAVGGGDRIGIELRTGIAQLTHGDHAGSLIPRAFERMQIFGLREAS